MTVTAPKNDRRILRTRKLLWEALIALIQEKEYSEITIQDIADRANVNRVTFYLHYRDKQDLLENSVEVIFNDLTSKITPLTGEKFRLDVPPEGMTLVYRYIAENAKFYRIILGENGIPFLVDRIPKVFSRADHPTFPAGDPAGKPRTDPIGDGRPIRRRLDYWIDHLVAGK